MQSPRPVCTRGDLTAFQHNPFGLRNTTALALLARSAVLWQGSAIWYTSGRKQETEANPSKCTGVDSSRRRSLEKYPTELLHRACSYSARRPLTSAVVERHYGRGFEQMENSTGGKPLANGSSMRSKAAAVWLVTGANRGMGFAYVSEVRH